jgi:hypothetical protein
MGIAARLLATRFSQEELEKQLDAVLKEHVAGKALVEWQAGDSAAKKSQWLQFPPSVRMHDIAMALSILDPATYPIEELTAINQTRVTFT